MEGLSSDALSERYEVPGQRVYRGVIVHGSIKDEMLYFLRDMDVYDDDIFVVSYPKSGTTWVQEIVWLIMNDANVLKADATPTMTRIPYIERSFSDMSSMIETIKNLARPRVLKSHVPFQLMSTQAMTKNAKIVVAIRNLKDVAVSYFHFYKSAAVFGPFEGTWSEFYDLFMDDHLVYGSWYEHVLSWWAKRNENNVLLVKYEEMRKDHVGGIRKIAEFLGKPLDSDKVEKIRAYTEFDQMKVNPGTCLKTVATINQAISPFYRKGRVGNWKEYFTIAQNEKVDKMYKEKMAGSGLMFEFD